MKLINLVSLLYYSSQTERINLIFYRDDDCVHRESIRMIPSGHGPQAQTKKLASGIHGAKHQKHLSRTACVYPNPPMTADR